jgi:branched-chain amino acid transport system substrate-binding protein
MKRNSSVVLEVALLLLLALSLSFPPAAQSAAAADNNTIKIGAVFSITGPGGFLGTRQRDGVLAIADDVNKHGGIFGKKLEVLVEDDQTSATNAVLATTKLIKDENVAVIIGPSTTDSGTAMIPVCEKEKVPFILTGPVVSPFKKWVFLIGAGDVREASFFLKQAIEKTGAKRIALIHDTSSLGITAAKVLNKDIKKYPGCSLVIQEKCEMRDTTMVPQLSKIKAAKPDTLLVYTTYDAASVITKNIKQLGMNMSVVFTGGVVSPAYFKNVGTIPEEKNFLFTEVKVVTAEKLPANDPYRKNIYEPFKKVLQAKFGQSAQVTFFHAIGADGMYVAIEALKAAGTDDRSAIRDALEKVRCDGFVGHFACTTTDHQGASEGARVLMMIKNGELTLYEGDKK